MTALRLSYSAISTWRSCPKRYEYSYFEGLRPKYEAPPLVLGNILHLYLETFYRSLTEGLKPDMAHGRGLHVVDETHGGNVKALADAAHAAGAEDAAKDLLDVVAKGTRLSERYYAIRGAADADRYEVMLVEERFDQTLMIHVDGSEVVIPSVVDLVVRDNEDGEIELWDHKSTGNIPREGRRLRDLQLTIYRVGLEEKYNIVPARVVWNYIRTKEPTVPKLLRAGGLSRDKRMDTTDLVYKAAIKANKLKVSDYPDLIDHFANREKTQFFLRVVHPIMQVEPVLFNDVIVTAKQVMEASAGYRIFGAAPECVRNLDMHCDRCAFSDLCTAAITGGDEEGIKQQHFNRRRTRGQS